MECQFVGYKYGHLKKVVTLDTFAKGLWPNSLFLPFPSLSFSLKVILKSELTYEC